MMKKIKEFVLKLWSYKIIKLILISLCVNLICDILYIIYSAYNIY